MVIDHNHVVLWIGIGWKCMTSAKIIDWHIFLQSFYTDKSFHQTDAQVYTGSEFMKRIITPLLCSFEDRFSII